MKIERGGESDKDGERERAREIKTVGERACKRGRERDKDRWRERESEREGERDRDGE